MQSFFKNGARIPIDIYIGDGHALKQALSRQTDLVSQNQQCFLTTSDQTFSPEGKVRLALDDADGLNNRCQMLLMIKDVEYLLLVIQTDEFLTTGLPIDSVNIVFTVNNNIRKFGSADQSAKKNAVEMILESIKPCCKNLE